MTRNVVALVGRPALAQPGPALPEARDLALAGVDGALRLVAERAVRRAGDGCGVILLTRGGRRITSVGTDPVAERLNALYDHFAENPCRSAWDGRTTIRAQHADGGPAVPDWMAAASDLGARSILSGAMCTGDRLLGVITLHSGRPGAFSADDEEALRAYALRAAALVDEIQDIRSAAFAASRAAG